MKNSAIQWTDHTFNAWEGCTKVAPECAHCYAETLVAHRFGRVKWGKGQPRRRTNPLYWHQPLQWNRTAICTNCGYAELIGSDDCRKCGRNFSEANRRRPRVFCLSLGDWLDEEVPIEWLADLLARIHATPNLDWQLLTKRPGNFEERIRAALMSGFLRNDATWLCEWIGNGYPPQNVWIGVSAGADQRAALEIPAKIHFLSCEPMLHEFDTTHAAGFNWIIFGGESGKNARPCYLNWIRDGVAFCRRNNIAPFVKQLGANPTYHCSQCGSGISHRACGPTHAMLNAEISRITDSHGGDWNEWPEDLRGVREFPA